MTFPGGKTFALAIVDDTDVATVENIKPVYRELALCGIRATKTVWMKRSRTYSHNFHRSQTMEDADYAAYVLALHREGFEIAFHGASMESSRREEILQALEDFRRIFGSYPRIHINHAENQDNLYWGPQRFQSPLLRLVSRWNANINNQGANYFQGHNPASDFFWGDACAERIDYVRNFCFDTINQVRINPSQPYHDPCRPFVKFWFSGYDVPDVSTFNHLLSKPYLDRLEREGGVCIAATHFGKFFVRDGILNPATQTIFRDLAERSGWYPSVSELLDYLRARADRPAAIGMRELKLMEWRWFWYRIRAKRDLRPKWAEQRG